MEYCYYWILIYESQIGQYDPSYIHQSEKSFKLYISWCYLQYFNDKRIGKISSNIFENESDILNC